MACKPDETPFSTLALRSRDELPDLRPLATEVPKGTIAPDEAGLGLAHQTQPAVIAPHAIVHPERTVVTGRVAGRPPERGVVTVCLRRASHGPRVEATRALP